MLQNTKERNMFAKHVRGVMGKKTCFPTCFFWNCHDLGLSHIWREGSNHCGAARADTNRNSRSNRHYLLTHSLYICICSTWRPKVGATDYGNIDIITFKTYNLDTLRLHAFFFFCAAPPGSSVPGLLPLTFSLHLWEHTIAMDFLPIDIAVVLKSSEDSTPPSLFFSQWQECSPCSEFLNW